MLNQIQELVTKGCVKTTEAGSGSGLPHAGGQLNVEGLLVADGVVRQW